MLPRVVRTRVHVDAASTVSGLATPRGSLPKATVTCATTAGVQRKRGAAQSGEAPDLRARLRPDGCGGSGGARDAQILVQG